MLVIKNYVAAAAVPAYTIVKPGGIAYQATGTTAAADKAIGVSSDVDAAIGDRMDVIQLGEGKVVAGAAFAAGDLLMSDGSARAITAAAAAGTNVRTIGYANQAANALGDICEIMVQPGIFQG